MLFQMFLQKITLVLGFVALSGSIANAAGPSCSKYIVESAGNELTFMNYLFQDFRDLSGTSASPKAPGSNNGVAQPAYEAAKSSPKEPSTAMKSYFQGIPRTWLVSSWSRMSSPVPMKNQPANAFIGK